MLESLFSFGPWRRLPTLGSACCDRYARGKKKAPVLGRGFLAHAIQAETYTLMSTLFTAGFAAAGVAGAAAAAAVVLGAAF